MHQLRRISCAETGLSCSALPALPHQLQQLTELDSVNLATEGGFDALASMPALTKLTTQFVVPYHADFLLYLPALVSLALLFTDADNAAAAIDIPCAMSALQSRPLLLELSIHGDGGFHFTSEQLTGCVRHLPLLQSVALTAVRTGGDVSWGTLPICALSPSSPPARCRPH